MGFRAKSIEQELNGSIRDICKRISMPEDFRETFQDALPGANVILFGFERNESNHIYKAYLEFTDRIDQAIKQNSDNPGGVVIHSGFKWDASDNSRKTMTTYTCFPLLPMQQMLVRLSSNFYGGRTNGVFPLVQSVLGIAATRTDPRSFLYFEASEENNERSSFDINLYAAGLRLAELYPLLLQICWHYAIPYREFNKVYEPVKTQKFGHLTGGRDREERDFLTVYFGEKGSAGSTMG
jgi:hypothetical protein